MSPFPSPPVAIITGSASGIGAALASHLHSKGWKLFLADISPHGASTATSLSSASSPSPTFIRTDVSSFSSQATLFKTAYDHAGHIDFVAANAGIDDRESVHAQFPTDAEPQEPDLATLDVDLKAVFYGLKLFVHYARKARAEHPELANAMGQMNFVATASMMGIYPFPVQPTYAAAKHGVVGLVRSVGKRFLEEDNIAVNAILPVFVATGLAPEGVVEAVEKKGYLTPMSSILRAYDELLAAEDLAGETVEVSGKELYWRKPVGFSNWGSRWFADDPDGLWSRGYGRKEKEKTERGKEVNGEKT